VIRIRGRLELPFLLAAQAELFANALDPMNANLNAITARCKGRETPR